VTPPHTDPSWFCFVITVRDDAGFHEERADGLPRSEPNRDRARSSAATCFGIRPSRRSSAASSAIWANTDAVMNRTFFVGVYPGIDDGAMDYVIDAFRRFLAGERTAVRSVDADMPSRAER